MSGRGGNRGGRLGCGGMTRWFLVLGGGLGGGQCGSGGVSGLGSGAVRIAGVALRLALRAGSRVWRDATGASRRISASQVGPLCLQSCR